MFSFVQPVLQKTGVLFATLFTLVIKEESVSTPAEFPETHKPSGKQ